MNVMAFHVTFVTYRRDRQSVEPSHLCQSSPLRWQVLWWFESRHGSDRRPAAWHRLRLWRWRPVSRASYAIVVPASPSPNQHLGFPQRGWDLRLDAQPPATLLARPKPDPVGREPRPTPHRHIVGLASAGPKVHGRSSISQTTVSPSPAPSASFRAQETGCNPPAMLGGSRDSQNALSGDSRRHLQQDYG
jgi:hypothetical protein